MSLLNDDDEQIMKTFLEITAKWASERPGAAKEGMAALLPTMLAFTKTAPDIGRENFPEDEIVSLSEDLVSDLNDDDYEQATARIKSFFFDDGPAPKSLDSNEAQQESPSE